MCEIILSDDSRDFANLTEEQLRKVGDNHRNKKQQGYIVAVSGTYIPIASIKAVVVID